jgi:5-(hydroxymethyl)furfural/furfural oxidase
MLVRFTSKSLGILSDMHLHLWERSPGPLADDPLSRQIAQSMVQIHKPFSKGSVHLNPQDPAGAPIIDTNTLGDPRDMARMVEGFRYMCDLLNDKDVAPLFEKSFVPSASLPLTADRNRRPLLEDSFRGQMISTFGALAVDWVPGAKRGFLRMLGRDINSILAEPDKLEDFVRSISVFGGHPAGTCRLGSADDREAVVDSRCRVIGVEGVRVVDASIFPEMMTGGTHTPAVMAGEKCADMVLQDIR